MQSLNTEKTMKKTLIQLFTISTPVELAAKELAEAQRELLACHTAEEYAKAIVAYNHDRIVRLKAFLDNAHPIK